MQIYKDLKSPISKEFEKLSDDELRTMITRDLIIGIKTLS